MFSKTNNPGSGPARPITASSTGGADRGATSASSARPAVRVASILGADLSFEGSISGEGELLVDGHVKGDIHVARLVIGEQAHVEGTVRGGAIEVRGQVTGNVEGKAIHLLSSAHVEGDITHEQLSIDVGAFFQGRCSQFRPPPVMQPIAAPIAVAPPVPPVAAPAPVASTAPAASPPPVAEIIPLDAHQA
jgi:cytoskeletal protein CcmA (bactofilin family)